MENNFREILFLIEQIDVLKALLRDTRDGLHYSWNADEGEDPEPLEATDEVRALGGGVALHRLWERKIQVLAAMSLCPPPERSL